MNASLINCEPAAVFRFFEEISAIPRGSGKEAALSEYLCDFAKKQGLEYDRDSLCNVIIKKPASIGAEASLPCLLQGHQDMVCEKNADVSHDFDKEGIRLIRQGDYLTADGTTLGADNGIAVAMMLAILADDTLIHPPLECVFTVQEEIGLIGAAMLDGSLLHAKTMINLDSEEEGTATVSCAGGLRVELSRKMETEKTTGMFGCRISVGGLLGGHSGCDIHKERINANQLMGRILIRLYRVTPFALVQINGGNKDNAIPRECEAVLAFASAELQKQALTELDAFAIILQKEIHPTEPMFFCRSAACELAQAGARRMTDSLTKDLIALVCLAPNGVQSRNLKQGGFVVSSSNLGVVRTTADQLTVVFSPRSSVESLQEAIKEKLHLLGEQFGFLVSEQGEYPGWQFAEVSPIRELCKKIYYQQTGKELKTAAIHAGLECGLFQQKLPNLDAIAIGPNMYDVHTPDERLELSSCKRVYQMLISVLEALTKDKE